MKTWVLQGRNSACVVMSYKVIGGLITSSRSRLGGSPSGAASAVSRQKLSHLSHHATVSGDHPLLVRVMRPVYKPAKPPPGRAVVVKVVTFSELIGPATLAAQALMPQPGLDVLARLFELVVDSY
jgi:hypothetical protein